MISVHTRKIMAFVITLVLAAAQAAPAHAEATTVTERMVVQLDSLGVSLTACNGEAVPLTGEIQITSQTTIDAGGMIHERLMSVPHNVRGVGSVTGTQYRAVGGDRWVWYHTADPVYVPYVFTQTDLLNLVGQGQPGILQTRFLFHYNVDADGAVKVAVEVDTGKCIG
jgi:hypothetical protein